MASRDAGGKVLNAIAHNISALVGGAADLAPSTKTRLTFEGAGDLEAETPGGRNMHFGVREHAMGAIANGMALSYLRPFTATFLVFSDYMRPPIRLAAIMELPTIFVFSHDSIGVGEDGPTHQPVEHLAALRAIPGLNVIRPADANETGEAWRVAMTQTRMPSCIILSRQKLPTIDRGRYASADQLAKGAYVLADADGGDPELLLLATGSEVSLALGAHEQLAAEGVRSRVVSMPSLGFVRTAAEELSRRGAAAFCPRPRRGGAGELARLGPLCRARRRDRDHEHIRRVRSVCETQGEVRFHNCTRRRGGAKRNEHGEGMMANRLHALESEGQAVWLDYLDRSFLAEGGFTRLIEQDGVTGVTSNPSIFEKAIGHGSEYDEDIAALVREGDPSLTQIYEHLAITDIQAAADALRPVYDRLNGADGFASIEVSPFLADSTQGTIDEARRLWAAVDRPNLMVKVPGTRARRAGGPRTDLERRQRQHHPALRDRHVQGGRRSLSSPDSRSGSRGARISRAFPRWRASSSAASTPDRRGDRRADKGRGCRIRGARRAARKGRDRQRQARLSILSRTDRERPLAGARGQGRAAAAPALGVHRNQGPGL